MLHEVNAFIVTTAVHGYGITRRHLNGCITFMLICRADVTNTLFICRCLWWCLWCYLWLRCKRRRSWDGNCETTTTALEAVRFRLIDPTNAVSSSCSLCSSSSSPLSLLNCSCNRIISLFHHFSVCRRLRQCPASGCPVRRHLLSTPVIDGRRNRVRLCWRRLRQSTYPEQDARVGRKRSSSGSRGIHYLLAKREGSGSRATVTENNAWSIGALWRRREGRPVAWGLLRHPLSLGGPFPGRWSR